MGNYGASDGSEGSEGKENDHVISHFMLQQPMAVTPLMVDKRHPCGLEEPNSMAKMEGHQLTRMANPGNIFSF